MGRRYEFAVALPRHLPTKAPVEAVDEPLTYGAEISDVGHCGAVRGVRLEVHRKGKRGGNVWNIPQLRLSVFGLNSTNFQFVCKKNAPEESSSICQQMEEE